MCFLFSTVSSQNIVYKQVKVKYSKEVLEQLSLNGFTIDHIVEGEYILLSLNEEETETLRESDIEFNITIENLGQFYVNRNAGKNPNDILRSFRNSKDYTIPDGFALGSMGGFCTYSELLDHLNFMSMNYPNLIAPIDTIEGETTVEGRPVYWTKISDNPLINEEEPEVLYTSLVHAREAGSMQQMLFFMYYLLENYNTDDRVKQLVDQTELYFIPCVNPDGYLYNESMWPEGGGMWRKNRKLNEDSSYGVDINRNFGYEWGHDDFGSSSNPPSSTYRGPEAFSEPETRNIKSFCEQHTFSIAMNYHTHGNYILQPWAYVSYIYSPHHNLFQTYGKLFTAENHYRYDNAGSLIYLVNGDSNDWMYGDLSTKPRCMAFTPEIGSEEDGFWPEIERIIPHCIENLHQNMLAAELASEYILLKDKTDFNLFEPTGYLKFSLQQVGLIISDISVSIEGRGDHFMEIGAAKTINALDTLQIIIDSIPYKLRPGIYPGENISYIIHIESGNFHLSDTLVKSFGPSTMVFVDSCNNLNHWESADWNVSTAAFFSASTCITDSPGGYYPNSTYSEIQTIDTIDLTEATSASLQFQAKWRLDGGTDYVTCKISSNYGLAWTALNGQYTTTNFVPYFETMPVYYGKQPDWIRETLDLRDYCGEKIMIKFTLNSDIRINRDGFYFDDVIVKQIVAEKYEQEIFLLPGWNSLSSYLIPENPALENIFDEFLQDILIIQDDQGFFQPQNQGNTLQTWDTHSGYFIKVSENVSLEIPGYTEHNRHFELQQGWNLIPVISSTTLAVQELNIQPPDSYELILQPNTSKVFWPSMSIQTLDSLYPGNSYLIKQNEAAEIDF